MPLSLVVPRVGVRCVLVFVGSQLRVGVVVAGRAAGRVAVAAGVVGAAAVRVGVVVAGRAAGRVTVAAGVVGVVAVVGVCAGRVCVRWRRSVATAAAAAAAGRRHRRPVPLWPGPLAATATGQVTGQAGGVRGPEQRRRDQQPSPSGTERSTRFAVEGGAGIQPSSAGRLENARAAGEIRAPMPCWLRHLIPPRRWVA